MRNFFSLALIAIFCLCTAAFAQSQQGNLGNDVIFPTINRLASPELVTPLNNASLEVTNIELSWRAVTNASYYIVQVSKGSESFTGDNVSNYNSIQGKRVFLLEKLTSGKYYWRVKAIPNNDGMILNNNTQVQAMPYRLDYSVESNWSAVRTFTITAKQTITPDPTPEVRTVILPVPQLLLPANGAFAVSTTTNLTWRAMNIQATYNLQISTDPKFTTGLSEVTGLTVASYSPQNLAENTHYYWRVKAIAPTTTTDGPQDVVNIMSQEGEQTVAPTVTTTVKDSEWSQVWAFNTVKTIVKMNAPEIIAPTAGTTTGRAPELSWTAVDRARLYHVQVARDAVFRYIVFGSEIKTSTSVKLPLQPQGATLYWRVRAIGNGIVTPWTSVSSFVTETVQVVDGLEMRVRAKILETGDVSATSTVAGNKTSSYYVAIKNTSSRAVNVLLTGTGGQTGWTVNYYNGAGKVVTSQMVNTTNGDAAGSYSVKIAPFGTYTIRVDVTPASGSNVISQISNTVTAVLADNTEITAAVSINTYRK